MAAQGHILDGNTLALYRLDESYADPRSVGPTDLSGTQWTLPDGGSNVVAYAGTGLSGIGPGLFARSTINSTTGGVMQRAAVSGDQAKAIGSWTVEAFVRANSLSVVCNVLYLVGNASPDSEANNAVMSARIETTGRLGAFWESGAGANNTAVATTGTVAAGTWYHLAWVKDAAVKTYSFFINGVQQGAAVSYATEATGGTGAMWTIGRGQRDSDPAGQSALSLRALSFSTVARNSTWLAANAALLATTGVLVGDADTYFNVSPTAVPAVLDTSGNDYHLVSELNTLPSTTYAVATDAGGGLIADGGRARLLDRVSLATRSYIQTIRDALTGDFTFEGWVQTEPGLASLAVGLFCHGRPGTEDQASNYFAIQIQTTGAIRVDVENGLGINDGLLTDPGLILTGRRYHIAVRKKMFGSTWQCTIFVDGVQAAQSATTLTNYDGGTNTSTSYLEIGRDNADPNVTTVGRFLGYLDDVRLSSVARTDEEIAGSYWRGVGTVVAVEVVSPQIGSQLDPLDPVTFDVTSDAGLSIANVLATLYYGDGSSVVVWNGSAFAAGFEASSTTPITGGHRFELIADWAQTIARIDVSATDSIGESAAVSIGSWIVDGGAPQLTVLTTFSADFRTGRLQSWQGSLTDWPSGSEMAILVHYVERNEMYVARDAEGNWRWPFDLEPDNAVDLNADPVTVQLAPRGGWPPSDVEIQIAAAVMAEEA